jgi:hypothetical protein
MARVQTPHDARQRTGLGLEHEVNVVGHQRPRETARTADRENARHAVDEVLPIVGILEQRPAVETADHHVVGERGTIEADSARH